MGQQGVIIMDTDRRISVVSSGAQDLLGWRGSDVEGLACSLVLDCRDADGNSLCERCGGREALERQEITAPAVMSMADPTGGRQLMRTSFWHLPPTGTIFEHRVMAVLTAADDAMIPVRRERPA